jgi:hypothetical protein
LNSKNNDPENPVDPVSIWFFPSSTIPSIRFSFPHSVSFILAASPALSVNFFANSWKSYFLKDGNQIPTFFSLF